MEEDFQQDPDYVMRMDMRDVRLLHKSVCFYLQNWPGYPACPIEEQQELSYMKDYLYRLILEEMWNK